MLKSILADLIDLAGCIALVTGTYMRFGLATALIAAGVLAVLLGTSLRCSQGIDNDLTTLDAGTSENSRKGR
mgnify:CR=1 FL=1